jgi:hypothetical protein
LYELRGLYGVMSPGITKHEPKEAMITMDCVWE